MSRKVTNTKVKTDTEVETMEEELQTGEEPEKVQDEQDQDIEQVMGSSFGEVLLSGKGKKLSPKSNSYVYFEIAVNKADKQLHIRLSGNDGGGLHSKEFIPLQTIFDILDQQRDKPFRSTVLKSVFKGGSANNAGFMAAVMRSEAIGLILPSEKSVFLHVLAQNYDERRAELLELVDSEITTDTADTTTETTT